VKVKEMAKAKAELSGLRSPVSGLSDSRSPLTPDTNNRSHPPTWSTTYKPAHQSLGTHFHVAGTWASTSENPPETLRVLRETLPVLRETLRVLREMLPVLRKMLPVLRKTLPMLCETLPMLREALSALRKALPALRETLRVLREALPVRRNLPRHPASITGKTLPAT
jgi:hypothetical protein